MFHIAHWWKRWYSDPHTVNLFAILFLSFFAIYFFGHLITPLLVAIVLAYLLERPISSLVKRGFSRLPAVLVIFLFFVSFMLIAFFGLLPTTWKQVGNLVNDIPNMYSQLHHTISKLPQRYPELASLEIVDAVIDNAKNQVLSVGEKILKGSFASIISLVTITVYLFLVPLMTFLLLKDKDRILVGLNKAMPKNRELVEKVWAEVNQKISNYINGKIFEIAIVGSVSYATFTFFRLHYSILLAVAVGFSVLIPYIGAALVTVPVAMVGLFQWGLVGEFYWMMATYGVIQILDGNILVPVLFSEAVNLHPVSIITAVLFFGGLWGFWGVFFAIPLGALVKAVWQALLKGRP